MIASGGNIFFLSLLYNVQSLHTMLPVRLQCRDFRVFPLMRRRDDIAVEGPCHVTEYILETSCNVC